MLEHVALGQSRFVTPGVAPDTRGVLLGRFGVLQFPSIEGLVSWLRLYSAESSLDELLASMQILRVSTPLKSVEILVKIPAVSSYTMDRAARCAHLVGGSIYTGSGKHFVKYRDDRSPYGYDATEIRSLPQGAAFMLHGDGFTQTYAVDGELNFARTLFRLSLRRVAGVSLSRQAADQDLVIAIERGLGEGVIRYLWRNRVEAELGLVRPSAQSDFDERDQTRLIARVRNLEPRILELFASTPGITIFQQVASNVAVELGYRHVVDLSSCSTVFAQDRYFFFWGHEDRVDSIPGPLELSGIEHLTHVDIRFDEPEVRASFEVGTPEEVGVDVRLAPSLAPPRHVVGTLIPLSRASWVKRLVFLLPHSALRGQRVAVTERGIVLVAAPDVDVVPLGQLLVELSPGLMVPLGMDLVPRVAPDVLARTLGHAAGVLTIFPGPDEQPFQLSESALAPLERRALAAVEVERAEAIDLEAAEVGRPDVRNDPVGRFALWGFPSEKES